MNAPAEDKSYSIRKKFYKELEKVFSQFPKYQKNILLRGFIAKPQKDDIFTRNIWSVSFHEYRFFLGKRE